MNEERKILSDYVCRNPEFDLDLSPTQFIDENDSPRMLDTENLCLTLWGPPRMVILHRTEQAKSLGISIVGGKLDFSGPGNTIETCISGIFIKHVIPDSLAGRYSTLKTGDRILEVNGYNLRDATHDHAVEIIRSAQSPVYFLVQSLLDPSNSTSQEKPYEYLDGEVLTIEIRRNLEEINEPLGLSLIGHRDPEKLAVFVCDIQSDSLFDRDNRLRIGDQLLQVKQFFLIRTFFDPYFQVNDDILLGKPHSIVTSVIKSIKSETLSFIVLRYENQSFDWRKLKCFGHRNCHGVDNMALNNPYTSNQRHDHRHVHEYKKVDAQLASTSVFPSTESPLSNPITTMEDMENGNEDNLQIDQNSVSPLSSDVKSSLSPASFDHSSNINQQSLAVNKAKLDYNGSFVSHIPMMSSSSSSASIAPLNEPAIRRSQTENLTLEQPRTRPIVLGQETLIEIDREQSGLGLSVVGGFDTQLVRK